MRSRVAMVAAVLAVLPAGLAGAQEPPDVRVAGPTPEGVELRAHTQDDETCVRLVRNAETLDGACGSLADAGVVAAQAPDGANFVVGGAVPEGVDAVDLQESGGIRHRSETAAASGFGGIRFFLSERAGGGRTWLARMLDRAGAVIDARALAPPPWAAGPFGLSRSFRSTLTGYVAQGLVPLPMHTDRVVSWPCVRLMRPTYDALFAPFVCRDSVPMLRPPADLEADRGRFTLNRRKIDLGRTEFFGLVSPEVVAVEALLGSGRRLRARPRPVPAAMGAADRWVRLVVPRREAIRSVVVVGRRRRVLTRRSLWWAPQSTRFGTWLNFGGTPQRIPPGARAVAEVPGAPALRARDADDDLCLVLGRGGGCGPPPFREGEVATVFAHTRNGGVIAGTTTESIRRVVISSQGFDARDPEPRELEVETTPMPAHGSKWHPYLRVFIARVPSGDHRLSFRRADGSEAARDAVLPSNPRPAEVEAGFHPALTLRPRGGRRTTIGHDRDGCLAVMRRRRVVRYACVDGAHAISACRPRALVVAVRGTGARVATREGALLRMRRLRISREVTVAVAAVPPRLHPTAIVRGGERLPLGRFPSSREQCGFEFELDDS